MDKRKLMAGMLAAAALTFGAGTAVAGTAVAAGPPPSGTDGPPTAGEAGEEQDSSYTGSVEAPAENEAAEEREEAAEDSELRKLAEIDRAAAEKAALRAVPGTVEEAELDDENGYVVYEVEVAGDDGKSHDVAIDAGNGQVLDQEAGEDEGPEEPDEEADEETGDDGEDDED